MKYIFLTYINRSGSTFLTNELSKFDHVLVCPEADILTNLCLVRPWENIENNTKYLSTVLKEDEQLRYWKLPDEAFIFHKKIKTRFDIFLHILDSYRQKHFFTIEYILYKNERLFQVIPALFKWLDRQTYFILSLVRDIRAIYYSQSTTNLPGSDKKFSKDPVATAKYWNAYINSLKAMSVHPQLTVKYESLISNLGQEMKRIAGFLLFHPDVKKRGKGLVFNFLPGPHKKIHPNIDLLPIAGRTGFWKKHLPMKDRMLIEIISAKEIIQLKYDAPVKKKPDVFIIFSFVYLNIKYFLIIFYQRIVFRLTKRKYD